MSEWQPIETAPKDGAAVLLYLPDAYTMCGLTDGIIIGHWSAADLPADAPEHSDDAWFHVSQTGGFYCDIEPTHWMPLPEPPEER